MTKITKNRKEALKKYDNQKAYSLDEVTKLLKDITTSKFDASIDLSIRLGVDPTKADQMVRGTVVLPHGSGKKVRVLVLCNPAKEEEAKKAGADNVGLDEYIGKIEKGWTDIDVIVATPDVMPKLGKLGKVLGPRNLMPNPKTGTVTDDVKKAVEDVKKGKIAFKVDKYGIIHSAIGKMSFSSDQIKDNAAELIQTVARLKPSSTKGIYIRSINMSSTMSPSILVDAKTAGA